MSEDNSLELNDLENDSGFMPEDNNGGFQQEAEDEIENKPKSSLELDAVYDIPVRVSAVLGKSSMQVNQLLKLGKGAILELDRKVGEPIDIYVNDRLVARGEVVVVEDKLGITMTEIIKTE